MHSSWSAHNDSHLYIHLYLYEYLRSDRKYNLLFYQRRASAFMRQQRHHQSLITSKHYVYNNSFNTRVVFSQLLNGTLCNNNNKKKSIWVNVRYDLQREHENTFLAKPTSQQFGGDVSRAAGAASRKRFMLFCEQWAVRNDPIKICLNAHLRWGRGSERTSCGKRNEKEKTIWFRCSHFICHFLLALLFQ